ncbi:MAG: segregation and condensation protein A [Planctomycetota bacterium]
MIAIAVKTENFEGPIELLLRMIERRKLAINEISLASVTDEYIAQLQTLPEMNYSLVTHFVYIASTLMLIKSRSLLPKLELTDEEEEQIENLEMRLRKFKIIDSVVTKLQSVQSPGFAYARPYVSLRTVVFAPDVNQMNIPTCHDALQELLREIPIKTTLPEVRVEAVVHIEDMMHSITERIAQGLRMSFRELTREAVGKTKSVKAARVTVVVGFLAMLEMVRNGLIHALQQNTFQDITLTGHGEPSPKGDILQEHV